MELEAGSKSRMTEDDLPAKYADLAKTVYAMAAKEGWPKEKILKYL